MMTKALTILGRVLLAVIFIGSGVEKLRRYGFFEALMLARDVPATWLTLPGAIALELGGGLSLATGYWPRLGALALILFLIPATLVFHTSIVLPIPTPDQANQQIQLMKNLAILGGLLLVTATPAASNRPG